jgi:hypothetical protein
MTPFAQIFGYSLAALGVISAFWLLKKHQYRLAAFIISGAFIIFAAIQIFSNGLLGAQTLSVEQFLCWGFGIALFTLSVYFAQKNSLSYAFAVLIMSAFSCFCGLSGVQAFLKTHLLWQVTTSLKNYGEKLDSFQTTVLDMRKSLTEQQLILGSNQMTLALLVTNVQKEFSERESDLKTGQDLLSAGQVEFKSDIADVKNGILNNQISNQLTIAMAENKITKAQSDIASQFQLLSEVSSNANSTLTNLMAQKNMLTNVESLVNVLFGGSIDQTFTSSETNKLVILNLPGVKICVFMLKYVPVENSIQAWAQYDQPLIGHTTSPLVPASISQAGNVIVTRFFGDSDLSKTTFMFRYIKDPHNINPARTMSQIATNGINVDGQILAF